MLGTEHERWLDEAADASRREEQGAGVPAAKQQTWQRAGSAPDLLL